MNIRSIIAASALACSRALAAHADPVTWAFYETTCTAPPGAAACPAVDPRNGNQDTLPFLVATLTLPDATSSGTAFWNGSIATPPVYTGDDFSFLITGGFALTQAFAGGPPGHDPAAQFSFDIRWNATPGNLTANIIDNVATFGVGLDADSPLSVLTGYFVEGNPYFGGCLHAACTITGFWTEVPIPEPGSGWLLGAALALLAAAHQAIRSARPS